jgi:signal transduction histidine kinase
MVPRVRLGTHAELAPIQRLRRALQISVPQSMGLMLAVLGSFAFALWLRQRHETVYLLAAVACVLWMVRTAHYYIDLPDGPLAYNWFWWATHASLAWGMLLSYLVGLRFLHQRHLRFERIVLLFVIVTTGATMPLWRLPVDPVLAQHLVNALVAIGGNAYITQVAHRSRDRDMRLIATGLWLGLLPGLHDLGLLAGWWGAEHMSLMPFTTLIIVAAFLVAVKCRFDDAQAEAEAANRQLGERLAEQGAQLQVKHEQLSEAERQQALLLERQRLMQDMHDGLGSSLLSAMVAVEQGRMSQEQVVEVLRECVDDLRLVIDSLEPVGHDLVSLLATMRYRLGKRLQSGGLMLEWDVQDLPPLPWLEPPDALHVLRLLQEALSNALKHAQASRVRIVTRDLGHKVEIRVEDDGRGFDPATVQQGRGLRSQVKRARRLGGTLQLDTRPGQGTRLSLMLPVHRPAVPVPRDATVPGAP